GWSAANDTLLMQKADLAARETSISGLQATTTSQADTIAALTARAEAAESSLAADQARIAADDGLASALREQALALNQTIAALRAGSTDAQVKDLRERLQQETARADGL